MYSKTYVVKYMLFAATITEIRLKQGSGLVREAAENGPDAPNVGQVHGRYGRRTGGSANSKRYKEMQKLGGAGICTYSVAVSKLARTRAFLVKLLMGTTFDVFIDSSELHLSAPKSTAFVEALWRRREHVPVALAGAGFGYSASAIQ